MLCSSDVYLSLDSSLDSLVSTVVCWYNFAGLSVIVTARVSKRGNVRVGVRGYVKGYGSVATFTDCAAECADFSQPLRRYGQPLSKGVCHIVLPKTDM